MVHRFRFSLVLSCVVAGSLSTGLFADHGPSANKERCLQRIEDLAASATDTMSWSHTTSGDNRIILVTISWQESTGLETLDSVTYDDKPMTLVCANGLVSVYALLDPPTGSNTVLATWSGSSA